MKRRVVAEVCGTPSVMTNASDFPEPAELRCASNAIYLFDKVPSALESPCVYRMLALLCAVNLSSFAHHLFQLRPPPEYVLHRESLDLEFFPSPLFRALGFYWLSI